jgi:hypothetical protein
LEKAKRFLRKFWWALVLGAGLLFSVLWWLFDRRATGSSGSVTSLPKPTFSERAKTELDRVRFEGELEKAKVKAEADAHIAELETIEKLAEDNPSEGRRQLSNWLRDNL